MNLYHVAIQHASEPVSMMIDAYDAEDAEAEAWTRLGIPPEHSAVVVTEIIITIEPEEGLNLADALCDERDVRWVLEQLDAGNEWAWCHVTVTASRNGLTGRDILGGCSYESEDAFKAGGYFRDMVSEALYELSKSENEHRRAEARANVIGEDELDTLARWEVSFNVYEASRDGTLVIHIDTTDPGPLACNSDGPTPLRVYINDGDAIYANPFWHCPTSRCSRLSHQSQTRVDGSPSSSWPRRTTDENDHL